LCWRAMHMGLVIQCKKVGLFCSTDLQAVVQPKFYAVLVQFRLGRPYSPGCCCSAGPTVRPVAGAGAESRTFEKVPRIFHVTFCQHLHKHWEVFGTYMSRFVACHLTCFLKFVPFLTTYDPLAQKRRGSQKSPSPRGSPVGRAV
jgi:hypothetical protein